MFDKLFNNPNSPFHYRDFCLLSLSRFIGTLGWQMLGVAIGWQIYEITHDPFAIGLVGLSQFLPSIILVLFAGQLADQMDRKLIMAVTHFIAAFAGAMLMLGVNFDFMSPALIYILSALLGAVRIFGAPAMQALLPNSVPPEQFSKAVALNSSMFQIGTIMGPAIGGALFFFGVSTVYTVAGILLLLAGILNMQMRVKTAIVKRPLTLENLFAGILFIKERPILLGAISLDLFAVLFASVIALLPVYAKDILHVGPQGLGLLRCAPAIGAVIMSLWLAKHGLKANAGRNLFLSIVVFAIVTIIFGLSTNAYLSFVMLMVLGCADMVSVYVRTHLMQMNTPDEMRGRVASVNMLFITTSNELGDFESGAMAAWLGTVPAVVVGGILSLAVAGIIAWRVPSLRNLKTLEEVK
ncbi:MAG: MFS transporter [Alphaproteobacteria bacterium]|nr:MFS transporter [Alphaproteobacteria bacterium]